MDLVGDLAEPTGAAADLMRELASWQGLAFVAMGESAGDLAARLVPTALW